MPIVSILVAIWFLSAAMSPQDEAATAQAVTLAKETLVKELDVDPAGLEVVSVEEKQWPDTSIGCPKEGAFYAQVITPGHLVVLGSGGKSYRVHLGRGMAVICPQPAPDSAQSGGDDGRAAMIRAARSDLARRLELDLEGIEVKSVDEKSWPDAGLGCPEPGMMYAQVVTPGYLIELEADGRRYRYHSDRRRAVLCEKRTIGS